MTIPLLARARALAGSSGYGLGARILTSLNPSCSTQTSLYVPVNLAYKPTESELNALAVVRGMGKRIDNEENLYRYLRATKSATKKSSHDTFATDILRTWLYANNFNPYPTIDEKDMLMSSTKLKAPQLRNWFSNLRKRQLFPVVEKKEPPKSALQLLFLEREKEISPKRVRVSTKPSSETEGTMINERSLPIEWENTIMSKVLFGNHLNRNNIQMMTPNQSDDQSVFSCDLFDMVDII